MATIYTRPIYTRPMPSIIHTRRVSQQYVTLKYNKDNNMWCVVVSDATNRVYENGDIAWYGDPIVQSQTEVAVGVQTLIHTEGVYQHFVTLELNRNNVWYVVLSLAKNMVNEEGSVVWYGTPFIRSRTEVKVGVQTPVTPFTP